MNAILGFILILVLGYMGSQLALFQKRFTVGLQQIFFAGTEYLFIGLLLGPHVTNVLSHQALDQLSPILSLGLGWMGLLIGLQFDPKILERIPAHIWKMSLFLSFFAAGMMSLLLLGQLDILFQYGKEVVRYGFPEKDAVDDAVIEYYRYGIAGLILLLAWIGTTSSYSTLVLMKQSKEVRGDIVKLLQLLTDLLAPIAIMVMGVAYCLVHVTSPLSPFKPRLTYPYSQHTTSMLLEQPDTLWMYTVPVMSGGLWLLLSILLGGALGWMLHYLTSRKLAENEMLLLMVGTVIFSGGVSTYWHLSPLMVNMIMGITLANLPSFAHARISKLFLSTEKPFYVVFMIFIGAMWPPISVLALILTAVYVVIRALALWLSAGIAIKLFYPKERKKSFSIGLALLPMGGVAVAMVVDFAIIHPGGFADLALNVVILSVLINQVLGPFFLSHVLKIHGERGKRPARNKSEGTQNSNQTKPEEVAT